MVMPAVETTYTLQPFSKFYDYVLPDIPGFVTGVIDIALRNAAIEFCEKSAIWKQTLDQIALVSGRSQYDVIPHTSQAKLADVLEAELGSGGWLEPVTTRDVVVAGSSRTGAPKGMLFYDDEIITVDPIPTASDTLQLLVSLKPARAATQLPSFLLERWIDVIAAGAKSRLMRMSKKPWTNLTMAAAYEADFQREISAAHITAARNRQRTPLRTTYVP